MVDFSGRDKYGDVYTIQAYEPGHPGKGKVFLELFNSGDNSNTLHMYSAKKARRLATSLLVAANIADAEYEVRTDEGVE